MTEYYFFLIFTDRPSLKSACPLNQSFCLLFEYIRYSTNTLLFEDNASANLLNCLDLTFKQRNEVSHTLLSLRSFHAQYFLHKEILKTLVFPTFYDIFTKNIVVFCYFFTKQFINLSQLYL